MLGPKSTSSKRAAPSSIFSSPNSTGMRLSTVSKSTTVGLSVPACPAKKPVEQPKRLAAEDWFEFPPPSPKQKPVRKPLIRRKSTGADPKPAAGEPTKEHAPAATKRTSQQPAASRSNTTSPQPVSPATNSGSDNDFIAASGKFNFDLREERIVLEELYPHMADPEQIAIDEMRKPGGEFERFDRKNQVYLDYTGGGQYAKSQIQEHMEQLTEGVYGNPHSINPTSAAATKLVDEARKSILDHFNASSEEYVCIITGNASGALHLLGESYPFNEQSHFLILEDNHNSVNGIREFAKSRGARVTYTHVSPDNLRMNVDELAQRMERLGRCCANSISTRRTSVNSSLGPSVCASAPTSPLPETNNDAKANFTSHSDPLGSTMERHKLLAFPAQSNFSGVKHPLDIIPQAQALGWDVLLDAAAFAPTNVLDLSVHKPDYVSLSFYKMFGYPTGLGALIARKSGLAKLQRPWFAGGTVEIVSVGADRHWYAPDHEMFEDGTVSYLTIPAIKIGLDFMNKIGMSVINNRVKALTGYLLEQLQGMFHSTGFAIVRIFGPMSMYNRGGTLTFDVYDQDNKFISDLIVEQRAMKCNISIRAGCFCNPGDTEALFASWAKMERDYLQEHQDIQPTKSMMRRLGSEVGAVRVSVGLPTNLEDIVTFLNFIGGFRNKTREELAESSAPTCGAH